MLNTMSSLVVELFFSSLIIAAIFFCICRICHEEGMDESD